MTRRVVTLPPVRATEHAVELAERARRGGAHFLEVRSDLVPVELDLGPLAARLPLLVSERGPALPPAWLRHATVVDAGLRSVGSAALLSVHSPTELTPDQAVALWRAVPHHQAVGLKHIEPLGPPSSAARLFETRRRLAELAGADRVTVLGTGPLALPFRSLLAADNALDYLALDSSFSAAQGQRLLVDAVRAARASWAPFRLGVIGTGLSRVPAPRLHPAPFDRIDVPDDTDLGALLDALWPYYRGLAVSAPFQAAAARHTGSAEGEADTLVRLEQPGRWRAASTAPAGARAVLGRLGPGEVTVLGAGRTAAVLASTGWALKVVRRNTLAAHPVTGAAVWTWPVGVAAPETLRFREAKVAVIACGAEATGVAAEIARRGGTPLRCGPAWSAAQARARAELWS